MGVLEVKVTKFTIKFVDCLVKGGRSSDTTIFFWSLTKESGGGGGEGVCSTRL